MNLQPNIQYSLRVDLAAVTRAHGAVTAMATLRESPAMQQAFSAGLLELTMVAQKERFTGHGPFPVADKKLGVVTGRLRRDLHAEPAVRTEQGFRGRIGSAVEYFRAHELGYSGTVQVPAHKRGRYTVAKRGYSVLEQSVRAHTRKVNIPRREPLMTAISEHSARIFNAAITRGAMSVLNAQTPT